MASRIILSGLLVRELEDERPSSQVAGMRFQEGGTQTAGRCWDAVPLEQRARHGIPVNESYVARTTIAKVGRRGERWSSQTLQRERYEGGGGRRFAKLMRVKVSRDRVLRVWDGISPQPRLVVSGTRRHRSSRSGDRGSRVVLGPRRRRGLADRAAGSRCHCPRGEVPVPEAVSDIALGRL